MKKSICITSLLLIVMLVPAMAFAQGTCPSKGHKAEAACCPKAAEMCGATKVALEKLMLQNKLDNVDLLAAKKKIEGALKEEMFKEKPSRKDVDKLIKKKLDVDAKLAKNHVDLAFAVRKILTPAQFKVFMMKHGCQQGGCGGSCGSAHGAKGCGSSCGSSCKGGDIGCGQKIIKKIHKKGFAPDCEKEIKVIIEEKKEEKKGE